MNNVGYILRKALVSSAFVAVSAFVTYKHTKKPVLALLSGAITVVGIVVLL